MAQRVASHTPLYEQLRMRITEEMESGALLPGAKLAPEPAMCVQYGVSRVTLRKAFDGLERAGLVSRSPRRGTIVLAPTGRIRPGTFIGVIGPSHSEGFMRAILEGIEASAEARGVEARFYPARSDQPEIDAMVRQAVEDGAGGVLLAPADDVVYSEEVAQLVQRGFPLCLYDRALKFLTTDAVMTDNVEAGRLATDHLLSLGHSSIAFASNASTDTLSVGSRLDGYRSALYAAGVPQVDDLVICGRASGGDGWLQDLAQLLGGPCRPTAVVAVNDHRAIDVMKAALARGLRIPDDMAVVGFDNSEMGHRFMVPLTSVEQPVQLMGRRAAETVLGRMGGGSDALSWKYVAPKLVVRRSSGGPIAQGGSPRVRRAAT